MHRGLNSRHDVPWRRKCCRVRFAFAARGARVLDFANAAELLPRAPPQRNAALTSRGVNYSCRICLRVRRVCTRGRFNGARRRGPTKVGPYKGAAPPGHRRDAREAKDRIDKRAILLAQPRNFFLKHACAARMKVIRDPSANCSQTYHSQRRRLGAAPGRGTIKGFAARRSASNLRICEFASRESLDHSR